MNIDELLKDLIRNLESTIGLRPVLTKRLSFDDYLLTQLGALMIEQDLVKPGSFSSVEYYSNQYIKGSDRPFLFDLSWNQGEGLLIISSVATDAEQYNRISEESERNKFDQSIKNTIELLTRSNASEAHYVKILYPINNHDSDYIYLNTQTLVQNHNIQMRLDLNVSKHDINFFSRTALADERVPATLFHISYKAPEKKSLIKNEVVSSLKTKWVKSSLSQNETTVDISVLEDRKSQSAQQVSTETLPTKTVKLKKNTYRECLREIRDELLMANTTILVHELADLFEKKVVQRYRKQCETESKSIPVSVRDKWIQQQIDEMLRAFESGGGGARTAQIYLYCVNEKNRKHYRSNLEALPTTDSKYDFNFFAYPYPEEDESKQFKAKRIKAFSLNDPALQNIEVLSINKGDDDNTRNLVRDLLAQSKKEQVQNQSSGTDSKRGKKPAKQTNQIDKVDSKQAKSTSNSLLSTVHSSVSKWTHTSKTAKDFADITLVDKIWLSVAQLHYENPQAKFFKNNQITNQIAKMFYEGDERKVDPGAGVLISSHLVAENPRIGVRRRYLTSEGRAKRRLFKTGDIFHPDRDGGEIHPMLIDVGMEFQYLLDWYEEWEILK